MRRMDQRDGDTGGERGETMQLSRQEMLEAWIGEGGRGVGERETNLRASGVLTGLDDEQIWCGAGRGGGGERRVVRKDQGELVNATPWLIESMDSNETH